MEITVCQKKIFCQVVSMGNDYQICLYGGDQGHIGSVVLAQPYRKNNKIYVTCSMINRCGHYDDIIASEFAKKAAQHFESVVCCSCGIHFDDVDASAIQQIKLACQQLLNQLFINKEKFENV